MNQPVSPRRRTLPLVAAVALIAAAGIAGVTFVRAQSGASAPAPAVTATTTTAPATTAADKVVLTVNGQPITESDIATAQRDLAEEIQAPAGGDERQAAIDAVVNLVLIAQAAESAKLTDSADFKSRMALLRQRVLRSEFVRNKITPGATEAIMKKRYEDEVGKLDPPEEVKASHILVPTEEEAKTIIEELNKGGDFVAIAKEKSKDPGSAPNGGDLGFFAKGQMVKVFEDAAFTLEKGKYTAEPVKSDFGFHVIRLDDKRKQAPPTFEEVKEQLQQLVMTELYRDTLADLRKNAKIDPPTAVTPAAPAPAAK